MTTESVTRSRWVVGQIGSRRNYLVPATFERIGRLERFVTDIWIPSPAARLAALTGRSSKILGRRNPAVPDSKVTCPWVGGLLGNFRLRRTCRDEVWYHSLVTMAEAIGRKSRSALARIPGSGAGGFWGFTLESLEAIREGNRRGLPTVLEQYDPGLVEDQLVQRYAELHPGWEHGVSIRPSFYFDRIRSEWQEATRIVVNSGWSKRCLVEQCVDPAKITVIPLAVRPALEMGPRGIRKRGTPIRVLFAGTFNLRKGAPDFVEVARRLEGDEMFEFLVAGPVHLPEKLMGSMPGNIRFLGPVARGRMPGLYRDSDVLLLPAVSEGFGIVQIEAGSQGLAVITTERVGEFVRDGFNGHLVELGDYDGVVARLRALECDRDLLHRMGMHSIEASRGFSPQAYEERLLGFIESIESGTGVGHG